MTTYINLIEKQTLPYDYSNPQNGTQIKMTLDDNKGSIADDKQGYSYNIKGFISPTKRDNRKLFVGGLPQNVTNAEFQTFFEQFGTVIDSIVIVDRTTRKSRGFGFVTFEDPLVAQQVLNCGNEGKETPAEGHKSGKVSICGKSCEVKASEPKESSSYVNTKVEHKPSKIFYNNDSIGNTNVYGYYSSNEYDPYRNMSTQYGQLYQAQQMFHPGLVANNPYGSYSMPQYYYPYLYYGGGYSVPDTSQVDEQTKHAV